MAGHRGVERLGLGQSAPLAETTSNSARGWALGFGPPILSPSSTSWLNLKSSSFSPIRSIKIGYYGRTLRCTSKVHAATDVIDNIKEELTEAEDNRVGEKEASAVEAVDKEGDAGAATADARKMSAM